MCSLYTPSQALHASHVTMKPSGKTAAIPVQEASIHRLVCWQALFGWVTMVWGCAASCTGFGADAGGGAAGSKGGGRDAWPDRAGR